MLVKEKEVKKKPGKKRDEREGEKASLKHPSSDDFSKKKKKSNVMLT